jgi:hypothetical protein
MSKSMSLVSCTSGLTMANNTFVGDYLPDGFTTSSYPLNAYATGKPAESKVFVRINKYEAGRATITVFNWQHAATVSVDLGSFLAAGTAYEVRDAQNFYGAPVASGTYQGGAVSLPMSGLAPAAPVGMSAPAPTGPEFNVFVVLPKSGGTQLAKGDANGDGKVDVKDIFFLISTLFGGGAAPAGSCDVNGDGKLDAADVFYLVNYLFAGGPGPK